MHLLISIPVQTLAAKMQHLSVMHASANFLRIHRGIPFWNDLTVPPYIVPLEEILSVVVRVSWASPISVHVLFHSVCVRCLCGNSNLRHQSGSFGRVGRVPGMAIAFPALVVVSAATSTNASRRAPDCFGLFVVAQRR